MNLTGINTLEMKYVLRPAIRNASSRRSPKAGSTSNSPLRKLKVMFEMWTRLKENYIFIIKISWKPNLIVPCFSTWFHFIGQLNILWIDVELPLSLPKNSGQYSTCMNSNSHIYWRIRFVLNISEMVNNVRKNLTLEV